MRKNKEFMQEVLRFLKLLENNFGKNMSIEELKEKFGEHYEGIIRYLHSERKDEKDKLIIGDKKSWRLNNYAFDKIQELTSRLTQENLLEKQTIFNYRLVSITWVLAFIALLEVALYTLELLSKEMISVGDRLLMGFVYLIFVAILIISIKKIK